MSSTAATISAAWQDYLAALAQAETSFASGDRVELTDLDRAEGYAHLGHVAAHAVRMYLDLPAEVPRLVRAFNFDDLRAERFLGDNADTRYRYVNLRGDRAYRITGRRGDEVYLSFLVHAGPAGEHLRQRSVAVLNQRDLVCEEDGTFEIDVARERPAHAVNWLPLSEDATCMITREYYVDRWRANWATYTIEQLGSHDDDVTSSEAVAARIRSMAAFVRTSAETVPQQTWHERNVVAPPFTFGFEYPSWGTPDNTYCRCNVDLEPGQALVLEGTVHPCVYFNVQLWNVFMQSIGTGPEASSVNRWQAGWEPGDRFRVVVSEEDPGVRPWLALRGHRRATAYIRWLCVDEPVETPTATLTTVAALRATA